MLIRVAPERSSAAISISSSKWPMLPRIAWSFIAFMCVEGDDVLVAGRGDDDVGLADGLLDGRDVEAVHQRLQRVDRVDLGDRDARALAGSDSAQPLPTSP